MRHHEFILALTSLFTISVSSIEYRRSHGDLEPLEPWQVTRLNTFSPSGRPGSDTLAHLWANITNPNSVPAGPGTTFDASSANCTVDWTYGGENPYGRVFECDTEDAQSSSSSSVSKWEIEVLEANSTSPSATTNMDVKFMLTVNLTVDGDDYYKVLVGTQHFQLGENMEGTCGGSGVCSWSLKSDSVPVLVQPTIVACEGTC
ncbi:uncharacterized protein F4807DRAFT_346033 [Annulohypoxylon truncatum]|uniref:uncharacterized protein n=1 Tax=Annulohypoxylon truncatum TaxID=327061 RepID=UPI0020076E89|nr:uncharacterized protein F4807DRAFT_346033 [Annulohypoxylon truncatum]KAI1212687.1 hypothetical protein F4807DRAFT_346033 [Annulohypoxylon truncatum]